ncbi:MAG: hypothetical protein K6F04_04230 [bacterium]|nr:hypothetical protein [bacterium]
MNKNKNVSGGILLEVIFMLAIMVAIFPFIQSNVKKRTDAIRNQMVVRDLVKLKTALENYLKRNPTFEIQDGKSSSINNVSLSELYDSGLEKSFKEKNVLGQTYKIRVKTSKDGNGNTVYDAIILATGEPSIPTMRIRDIVKEAKGYAGYVESNMVYGPGWQFSVAENLWGDGFDASSLVVRAGFSKKEYKYISRKAGGGTATMETDLYMNMKNINGINNLYIANSLEVGSFNFTGSVNLASGNSVEKTSSFDNITIAPGETSEGGSSNSSLSINQDMTISNTLNFPLGLIVSSLTFSDSGLRSLSLNKNLNVNNLYANDVTKCLFSGDVYTNSCNKLRSVTAETLNVASQSVLAVSNLLKLNDGLNTVLTLTNLTTKSFDSEKSSLGSVVFKFGNIKIDGAENVNYNITSSGTAPAINLNDIIVIDVNKKLLEKTKKIGGIDLSEKTPLSVVLRGLYYEYADIHKLIGNTYPTNANAFLPFKTELDVRCEYIKCGSGYWYY